MGRELVSLASEKAKQPIDLTDTKLVNALSVASFGLVLLSGSNV
jgi:hypothetical protein